MEDEKLITLVQPYEELYNVSHKKYSDNVRKGKLWKKIGAELNKTGSESKARWISLRDQFRKVLKKKKTRGVNDKKWRYEEILSYLIPYMKERETCSSVLDDEAFNESDNNEKAVDADYDSKKMPVEKLNAQVTVEQEVVMPLTSNPSSEERNDTRQRKEETMSASMKNKVTRRNCSCDTASSVLMKYLMSHHPQKLHPIDAFFNGLAATMKQFSPYYQNVAKSRIFSVVSEIELTQIQKSYEPSSSRFLPTTTLNTCETPNQQQVEHVSPSSIPKSEHLVHRSFPFVNPASPASPLPSGSVSENSFESDRQSELKPLAALATTFTPQLSPS